MKKQVQKRNNERVSILERLKLNMLLKKLNLAQLLVIQELVNERVEKLQRRNSL